MWPTKRGPSAAVLGAALLLPAAAGAVVRTPDELVAAVAAARAGQVIEVAPGTYALQAPLSLSRPGPATLRGTGLAGEVVLQGGAGAEVLRIEAAGWTVARLTIRGGAGVLVTAAGSRTQLDSIRVEDAIAGVVFGDASDLTCALSGLILTSNVLARIRGDALQLNSVCDAQIVHQTVFSVGRSLLVQGPSAAPRLLNNLWDAPVAVRGDGDLALPQPGAGAWFRDPLQLDLHLRPATPPIDAGVASPLSVDADGRRRTLGAAADVGAYELDQGGGGGGGGGADAGAGGSGAPGGGSSSGTGMLREGGISCAAGGPASPTGAAALLAPLLALALRRRR